MHPVILHRALGIRFADLLHVYISCTSGWLRGPMCCCTPITTLYTGNCSIACSSVRWAPVPTPPGADDLMPPAAGNSTDLAADALLLDDAATTDTIYLMRLYDVLVAAAHAAMSHFSTVPGATTASAKEAAAQVLLQGSCSQSLGLKDAQLASDLGLAIWSLDPTNCLLSDPPQWSPCIKTLRLTLGNITSRSRKHQGALLGALVYADTFVDVPACGDKPAVALNLTEAIAPLLAVACTAEEAELKHRSTNNFFGSLKTTPTSPPDAPPAPGAQPAASPQQLLASSSSSSSSGSGSSPTELSSPRAGVHVPLLGALLAGPIEATFLTGSALVPSQQGALYCFQEGLVLVTKPNRAVYTMRFSTHATAIWITELAAPKQGPGMPAAIGQALVFEGVEGACGLPPACHLTDSRCVALPLAGLPPGKASSPCSVTQPASSQTQQTLAAAGGCSLPSIVPAAPPAPHSSLAESWYCIWHCTLQPSLACTPMLC